MLRQPTVVRCIRRIRHIFLDPRSIGGFFPGVGLPGQPIFVIGSPRRNAEAGLDGDPGDESQEGYRARAAQWRARAKAAPTSSIRLSCASVADCYDRLVTRFAILKLSDPEQEDLGSVPNHLGAGGSRCRRRSQETTPGLNAAHYRARVHHWRRLADRVIDDQLHTAYLRLAETYGRLETLFEKQSPLHRLREADLHLVGRCPAEREATLRARDADSNNPILMDATEG
jgi:hypothetical protein